MISRRLQFGLRTWILICLILSVLLGLSVTVYIRYQTRTRQQRAAERVIFYLFTYVVSHNGDLPKSWAEFLWTGSGTTEAEVRADVKFDFSITDEDIRRDPDLIMALVQPMNEDVPNTESARDLLHLTASSILLKRRPLDPGSGD